MSPHFPVRILVVEDHSRTAETMTRLLSRWGYDVATANSLKGGLDQVDKESFDVILSDIALPDGTGYALISEVRRRGKDVMAIALSGYEYPAEVKVAKLTGFDYHLSKPCDCKTLRKLLDERVERRLEARAEKRQAKRSGESSKAGSR